MPIDTTVIAQRARAAGRLGIDTEFMGEGRYRPLLCLTQVAVPNDHDDGATSDVWVLDPIERDHDPAPLAAVLADPNVQIVLHAARQDVALLKRVWQTDMVNIFDTQVAAGFAGLRAQLGYEALLHELLDVRLRKSASFTRWDQRPLSEEQLLYAREDVLHLLQAARALEERLDRMGRLQWAVEECRALEDISDDRDVDALLERLPRIGGLDGQTRAIARELVAWREESARAADKPVSTVLQDAALVEIARRKPASPDRLSQIRGLHDGIVRRRGREIVEVVERGRERPAIPSTRERPLRTDPEDAPVIALAESLVRARALEADVAYELIAARADLERIVVAHREGQPEPDVRTLRGWRRELVGDELLALLSGERALRVDQSRRSRIAVD